MESHVSYRRMPERMYALRPVELIRRRYSFIMLWVSVIGECYKPSEYIVGTSS